MSIQFENAIALHQRGEFDEARAAYEKLLSENPSNDGVLHCMGLLCSHVGDFQNAVSYFEHAMSIDPRREVYQVDFGNALQSVGRSEEAILAYDVALKINPKNVLAAFNKGLAYQSLNSHQLAVEAYDRVIDHKSDHVQAFYNRGNSKYAIGLLVDAIQDFRSAISLNADWVDAHFNLGVVYQARGEFDLADLSYQEVIRINPLYGQAHYNMGVLNHARGRYHQAIECYRRILESTPNHTQSILNQGVAFNELGNLVAALSCFDRVIELDSRSSEGFFNRALVLKQSGDLQGALSAYDTALSIRTNFPEAWLNKGVVMMEMRLVPEAISCYDQAISQSAELHEALENKGAALLTLGRYVLGWELYESRWHRKRGAGVRRDFGSPPWVGSESLEGKTILLWAEQGLGDTLQFCRYVKDVAKLGARVFLQVQDPLVRLLQGIEGVSRIFSQGSQVPSVDFHCSLMSLPRAFKTTIETIPHSTRYIQPETAAVLRWQERLGERVRPRVGLVWSGGFRPDQRELWKVNERRNIPLKMFEAFGDLPFDYVSLQKGQFAESELSTLIANRWRGPAMVNLSDQMTDFAETAALIEELDLVISVDTSTAHLAGAMGKPTWILNRFDSCWRWMMDRADSPWYPSARLYRQIVPGGWIEMLERVRQDLAGFT
jgi:tetratricopeptide (TPR) repeat protein